MYYIIRGHIIMFLAKKRHDINDGLKEKKSRTVEPARAVSYVCVIRSYRLFKRGNYVFFC